jgi:serine phosphatase RsbU (regulator of sigma subunit)
MLAVWFGRCWPGTNWTVVPRSELIEKGRHVAAHFGLDVSGWKAFPVASVSKSLAHYGHGVPALSVRITYLNLRGQVAEVGFDSSGSVNYWRPPNNFKGGQKFDSDAAAADSAFQFLAGKEAKNYRTPTRFAGDEAHEEDYEFRQALETNSSLREQIKVSTKDSAVERAERKVNLGASDEDDDDEQGFAGVISALFAVIFFAGSVAVIGIYILWLVRKALDRKFQLRMAVAAFLIMIAGLLGGAGWDRMGSVNLAKDSPVIPQIFSALAVLCVVAVARGISETARPKWMSLEQLCFLAPLAKPTGESIAAGVLFGPLMAAVPFLIVGCGLFPDSWILPRHAELLYSRGPLFDSSEIEIYLCLLGFFGFWIPLLERVIRFRWLRWLLIAPLGVIVFSVVQRGLSGTIAAVLAAGILIFALFWWVWAYFDVLAILTLACSSNLVVSLLILLQKHVGAWSLIAALGGLLLAAFWCFWRGQPIAEGDPLAVYPMLSGFRAEREKLRAEFSVARRAQQDMLPQSPPHLTGYTIAASCTPSLEVGGDLYDFLKLRDGRVGIGVADVSGKGVPAALYMTLTKGLLASVTKDSSELGPVVEEVNRHLHEVTRKKVFVTMALGFLDAEKRVLQCVRAGHNPMVWRQKQRNLTTLVAPGGLGLGITASRVFSTQLKVAELDLDEGDAVVFYSDGITEAMNRDLEQFGEQRLMDAVDRTDRLDATAARDSILGEVKDFLDGVHPQDDMTLVVLRVGNPVGENQ